MSAERLFPLVACLCALALSSAARAADRPVARDTLIHRVFALDGDLVYTRRYGAQAPSRNWMRWVGGKLSPARAIPQYANPGARGRDVKGRKVFTFGAPPSGPVAGSQKWFAYDLAHDRARPVRGL